VFYRQTLHFEELKRVGNISSLVTFILFSITHTHTHTHTFGAI